MNSREYLFKNYGDELESLFRSYLKEENWSYTPISNDNYGELTYRAMTRCKKGNLVFIYVFIAQQQNDDWNSELYILQLDHISFFQNMLDWITTRNLNDILICDDFIVTAHNPPKNIIHYDQEFESYLSFYCELGAGDNLEGIHWFEQLLPTFTDFLERHEYTVNDIGTINQPVFEIWNKENLHSPVSDNFLFVAKPSDPNRPSFKFLFESECNGTISQGYAKISII